jgi:acyl-CoA reductase-like NAD-dependent aldehyde dehydrogenase
MLQHLKQADIDAIIAACEAARSEADRGPPEGEIPFAERDRVYSLIDALGGEAQDELLALMWTGGPKNETSFEDNLELARKTADDNHAAHLSEQAARLPDYLRQGLKKMAGG